MLYPTVLFDLDGTLIESGPGIIAAARDVLRQMGLPDKPDEVMKTMIGPPLAECFRGVLEVPASRVAEAVELYREAAKTIGIDLIKPYPGVKEMLSSIKNAGVRVGVVTSKITPTAKEHILRFGLAPYIEYVRGGFPGGSADKAVLIASALEELQIRADEAVMVGDRHFDIIGAKQTGVAAIGVTYGYGSREELEECSPAHIVNSAAELEKLLLL